MAGVPLASAFVSVKPDVDRRQFQKDGAAAGETAGKAYADGFYRDASGRLRQANGRFATDAQKAMIEGGRAAGAGFGAAFSRSAASSIGGSSTLARVAAVTAARFTLVGAAAAAAAPGVIHLTAALAPAAGALVVLPAAMAAVSAASATMKLATAGVGDAISAGLTGTAKQADKALKELPPSARLFAKSIIALKPQIADLRASVSGRFFKPLQDEVGPLAGVYFPMLRREMGGLAGSLGRLGERFVQSARNAETVAAVKDLFTGTRLAVNQLRAAVDPLVTSFALLIRVTAPELPGIAGGLANMARNLAAFITRAVDSGQVLEVFENAKRTLRDLGGIIVNVGSIVGSVFSAASATGGNLLGTFRALTGEAAAFLKSAQGTQALTAVFNTLNQLGQALRQGLGAVLPQIAEAMKVLGPAIAAAAGPAVQLLTAFAPLLPVVAGLAATVLRALTPAIEALGGWLTQNEWAVKSLAAALVAFKIAMAAAAAVTAVQATGGLMAFLKGTQLVTAATKIWTGVQWLLNAALRANPIGIVITVLTALGAGLVLAYRNSETFRNIVQAAWRGVQTAVSSAWNNVIKPAVTALVGFFRDVLAPAAMWLYNNIFKPVFAGIGWVLKAFWVIAQIVFKAFQNYLTNVVFPVVRFLYDRVVRPVFQAIGSAISGWWNSTAKPVFNLARAGFTALGSALRGVWENNIRPMFLLFSGFLRDYVAPAFRSGVDTIRRSWELIREAARVPVAFVVNRIINPFIGGINKAAALVGVKDRISPIPGFADGGQIPVVGRYASGGRITGAPSSTDNRMAPARVLGGAVELAGGEFVVNAQDTRKALPLLRWVNDGMKGGAARIASYLGRPVASRPGDGSEGWAFADGGLVGFVKDVWGAITNPVDTIKKPFEALLSRIPGAGMLKDFLIGSAKKLLNGAVSWLTGIGGGEGGGNVGKAMAFVRAQAGKPYVWASAGPGGYDCSGIVSAVYNLMNGKNPHSHTFSTGMLPGRWFNPGKAGPLMAGWSHPGQRGASANVGHMAGQIGALPFESRGSRGVVIGSAARRISEFASKGAARFALGGQIPVFDMGGTLAPGFNTVYNGLGRPEPLRRADTVGDVHFHRGAFEGAIMTNSRQAEDLVVTALKSARSKRKLP